MQANWMTLLPTSKTGHNGFAISVQQSLRMKYRLNDSAAKA